MRRLLLLLAAGAVGYVQARALKLKLTGEARIVFADTNYASRVGWKEIVVGDAESVSDELRTYPSDALSSPPEVTRVASQLAPRAGPETAPRLSGETRSN